jgi:hypothetical protein
MADQPQQQPQSAVSLLCGGGCGFYGSSATDGLCSKCFKDAIKRKADSGGGDSRANNAGNGGVESPQQQQDMNNDNNTSNTSAALNSNSNNSTSSPTPTPATVTAAAAASAAAVASSGAAFVKLYAEMEMYAAAAGGEGIVGEGIVAVAAEPPPKPKPRNRCHACNRKIGLTGFDCRCGGVFCAEHRYDKAHSCTFDYKTMEREKLRESNPIIVSEKIQRL